MKNDETVAVINDGVSIASDIQLEDTAEQVEAAKLLIFFRDDASKKSENGKAWKFFKLIFCEIFEIAAVQKYANLVELEKRFQTHIFLQNFVLIKPRTSPPKFLQNLPILLTLQTSKLFFAAQPAFASAFASAGPGPAATGPAAPPLT